MNTRSQRAKKSLSGSTMRSWLVLMPLLAAMLMLFAASPRALAAEAGDAARFDAAHKAYRAKDYTGAFKIYRELAEIHRSPALFYDLACAAFKSGKLGTSLVFMERARRLAPRDPDIATNLAFLRTRVKDSQTEEETDLVTRAVWAVLDRLTLNELAVAVLLLVWLSTGAAVLAVGNRDPGRVLRARLLVIGAVTLTGVAVMMLACKWFGDDGQSRGIVLMPEIPVLSGPASDEIKRFALHEGTRVRILKTSGKWLQIALNNGENGWTEGEGVGEI